jgi:cytochrome o ubiquinol oxidase subunit 2
LLPILTTLGACHAVVLSPSGEVAARQRNLLVEASALMLIVILPVMALTILFAWRYRQSNQAARYEPEWDHSMPIELVVWTAPLLIIICLGALTWVSTHLLDPYRPLGCDTSPHCAAHASKPLEVDVVALDWKWLFIYPQYGIATVNELAAPVDRPIQFRITASSVMNSFYIPALAGQIYAMPGMETRLNAIANEAGNYVGFSANYSGAGFSGMHFVFRAMAQGDFGKWLSTVKAGGGQLGRAHYLQLEQPSENEPVHRYASVAPDLYRAILEQCAEAGKVCMSGIEDRRAASRADGMAGIKGTDDMSGMIASGAARQPASHRAGD